MSLPSSASLSKHFAAWELGADVPGIPAQAQSNLYKVAAWMETVRIAFDDKPIYVNGSRGHNRGYRPPTTNEAVGGSSTSDHPNGLAADFNIRGVSLWQAHKILSSGVTPPWDQIIYYPIDGHIHVGLGARMRREFRIALAEGGYPILSPELLAKLRNATPMLLIFLVVLLLFYAARKGVGA